MNYIIDETGNYIANEGYVFEKDGSTAKIMALSEYDSIENYNIIKEPIIEEEEEIPSYEELLKTYRDEKGE